MKSLFFLFFLLIFQISFSMELIKVKENIFMVKGTSGLPSKENKGFISNAYAVKTKEGWVVIDSLSTPELSKEFISLLKKKYNQPVKYLVITHYHLDHYFGASEFKKEKAVIVAHENLKNLYEEGYLDTYLENIKKLFGDIFKNVKLTKPDVTVKDRYSFKLGEKNFVILSMTPAHTNTDIVVYLPKEKVLFAGDLVYKNRIPFVGDSFSNSKNWLNVLEKMKKMDIDVILAGHNEPLDKSAIDFTYRYISFLREEISKMKDEDIEYDKIKEKLQNTEWSRYPMFKVFHNKNIYKIYNDLDFEF